MLRFGLLVVGLLILSRSACAATDSSRVAEASLDSWRQTSHGWQRCEVFLSPPIEYRRPAVHPLVVGLLQILLTITAMLMFSDRRRAMSETQSDITAVRSIAKPQADV